MLFNNTKKRRSHLHYGTKTKARQTIRYLKTRPYQEQIRGAQAMYSRAKFHKNQTADMRDAMKVYAAFLKTIRKI